MSELDSQKSIAIIGSGISGLSCAYLLHSDFKVTVFEKESKLGGHTDTHTINIDGKELNIDSGFIVFCREHYPHFSKMLDDLEIESEITDMSFSAHNRSTGLIYNATSINKLFCQRKNLIKPRFYRMLVDLIRFYLTAKNVLDKNDLNTTVSEYLNTHNYSKTFSEDHLYPMISALWSATPEYVKSYPIRHLVEFLSKHGMMKIVFRPEWRVVKGGSSRYIKAIENRLNCEWRTNTKIINVERSNGEILINASNKIEKYDAVIFATHADQTLTILNQHASDNEKNILGDIPFERNHVLVHTDESVMHPNKLSWASWNTEVPNKLNPNTLQCCTANYWMNSLQNLKTDTNVFTSLNTHNDIDPSKILIERHYSHPIFTPQSVSAQKQKNEIDGYKNSYFVGAYWGWGFHEDGARSAAEVCEKIKHNFGISVI